MGLAEYFGIDSTLTRILFVVASLVTGVLTGPIAYIVLMLVMPEEGTTT